MIAKENGEEPAFSGTCAGLGLTKRELFAAMAMQGFLAGNANFGGPINEAVWVVAKASVNCADALLAELAKEKKE